MELRIVFTGLDVVLEVMKRAIEEIIPQRGVLDRIAAMRAQAVECVDAPIQWARMTGVHCPAISAVWLTSPRVFNDFLRPSPSKPIGDAWPVFRLGLRFRNYQPNKAEPTVLI